MVGALSEAGAMMNSIGTSRTEKHVHRRSVAGAFALLSLAGVAQITPAQPESKPVPPPPVKVPVMPNQAAGVDQPKGAPQPAPPATKPNPVNATKAATTSTPRNTVANPAPQPGNVAQPSDTNKSGAAGQPNSGEHTDAGMLPDISTDDPDSITLAAFSAPVELITLVELLATTLNINIWIEGEVTGSVVFNAPVSVKKNDFLGLVDALLEQAGYTITLDRAGFYKVHQISSVGVNLSGEIPTTRVFSTPNIRPSAMKSPIEQQLGMSTPAGQQPGGGRQVSYIDELGIIVATDTVRRLDAVESLIKRIMEEYAKSTFIRVELTHISAPVARERALQLVGQSSGASSRINIPGQEGQPQFQNVGRALGSGTAGLDNIGDRLTVDPQGNALIFRGLEEEIHQVKNILSVIDKPSGLEPRKYAVGAAAAQIADIARQRGLGEVTTIANRQGAGAGSGFDFNNQFNQANQFNRQGFGGQAALSGGSVMVVDETRGQILYYGTPEQHVMLEALVRELDIQSEQMVIRTYRVNHTDAEKMADLILGLIRNETPTATNALLPDGSPAPSGFSGSSGFGRSGSNFMDFFDNSRRDGMLAGDLTLSSQAFVLADKPNNQILVKAPARQQSEFERLIRKLDLRRPQVYVEATIVAVTTDDRLHTAIEQQLINAGGRGGVLNTNFGLSSFATGAGITSAKTVSTGLSGLTAALIKSDQVPIVLTALANETRSRIISKPQLLVDDNEEAEVVSLDQQPTSSVSRSGTGTTDLVTAGDYAEAGTTLKVKPQISDGGYLRLKYEIELSSFTSEGQTVGSTVLPPARQKNNVRSESVTVPSDFTVVIGGLVVNANTKTVAKIPLIGDIPLVGLLFQDRRTGDRVTRIYVFLSPRIFRDDNFADLRLFTDGPQAASNLASEFPVLRATPIEASALREKAARDGK